MAKMLRLTSMENAHLARYVRSDLSKAAKRIWRNGYRGEFPERPFANKEMRDLYVSIHKGFADWPLAEDASTGGVAHVLLEIGIDFASMINDPNISASKVRERWEAVRGEIQGTI